MHYFFSFKTALFAVLLCGISPFAISVALASPGLDSFLDDNGRLELPEGFSGSIDGSGYRMEAASGDAPRFLPSNRNGESTGQWQSPGAPAYGCNGYVRTMTTGPDGRVYFGGQFTICGNIVVNGIAVYDPATGEFSPMTPPDEQIGVDWWVSAMTFINGDLYIGGWFRRIGDVTANHIARWDGQEWHALGRGRENGVDYQVNEIVEYQGDVIVGGSFYSAGGTSVRGLARWNGEEWSGLSGGSGPSINGGVSALAVIGDELYIGGGFYSSAGYQNIVRWDGVSLEPLGGDTAGFPNDQVLVIEEHDGAIYVGGEFTEVNGASSLGLARWVGGQWDALDTGLDDRLGMRIYDLATVPEGLLAVGRFTHAHDMELNHVGIWDGSQFHAVSPTGEPGFDEIALSVSQIDDDVYIGGRFSRAGGEFANQIVRWNASDWSRLSDISGQGIAGQINAILVTEEGAYIGGFFQSAGSTDEVNLAFWNGEQWESLGLPDPDGVDGPVSALAHDGTNLYVGGGWIRGFDGSEPSANVSRWNGESWTAMRVGIYGTIRTLRKIGGVVYKGGSFTVDGQSFNHGVGYWDGTQWVSLDTSDERPLSARQIIEHDGQVTVAGLFPAPHPEPTRSIGFWTGSNWETIPDSGEELDGYGANSIASAPEGLYVGGAFAGKDDMLANGVARWDGDQWHALRHGAYTGVNNSVESVTYSDGSLYVTGRFTRAGGMRASRIAKWDGHRWFALGDEWGSEGISHHGMGLDAHEDTVYVGHRLGMAGGNPAGSFAWFVDSSTDLLFADGFVGSPVTGLDHLTFEGTVGPEEFQGIQSPYPVGEYEFLFDQDFESGIYGELRIEAPIGKQILMVHGNQAMTFQHQLGTRFDLVELEFGSQANDRSLCDSPVLGLSGVRDGNEVVYRDIYLPGRTRSYWDTVRVPGFEDLDQVIFHTPCDTNYFLSSLRPRTE